MKSHDKNLSQENPAAAITNVTITAAQGGVTKTAALAVTSRH
jgi:hypothetical protein